MLLSAFEQAYLQKHPASKTKTGAPRKRTAGAGRKGSLDSIVQKLLFACVHQKSYPLQSMVGELFGKGQPQANEWIHRLLPILKRALDDLGYAPERNPKKFMKKEQGRKDALDSNEILFYLLRDHLNEPLQMKKLSRAFGASVTKL